MDKELVIEKLVVLMRRNDLLFKSVVNYVDSAYKGCLTDQEGGDIVAQYKRKA